MEYVCSRGCTIWGRESDRAARARRLAGLLQVPELLRCHRHGLCWSDVEDALGCGAQLSARQQQQWQVKLWSKEEIYDANPVSASNFKELEAKGINVKKCLPLRSSGWIHHGLAQPCLLSYPACRALFLMLKQSPCAESAQERTSSCSSAVNHPEHHRSLSKITHLDTSSAVLLLPKPCQAGTAAFLHLRSTPRHRPSKV